MDRSYEPEDLKKIQRYELAMLDDLIEICKENKLNYFALAGTGIGAVRHQGFIPWDDDIDIGFPRKDFEKFLRIIEEKWSNKYYILNTERYENFPLMTTRLCLKGTRFVEECVKNIDCPFGIFLDLYPFDNIADDGLSYKLQIWTAWFWSKLLILRSIRKPNIFIKGTKGKLAVMIAAMVHDLLCFFRVPKKWLYERCKKACTAYNHVKTKRFGYPCDTDPHSNMLVKKRTLPARTWEFDNRQLAFPRDIKTMLEGFFGDTYMTLPPEEDRKSHCPAILDFGDEEILKKKANE